MFFFSSSISSNLFFFYALDFLKTLELSCAYIHKIAINKEVVGPLQNLEMLNKTSFQASSSQEAFKMSSKFELIKTLLLNRGLADNHKKNQHEREECHYIIFYLHIFIPALSKRSVVCSFLLAL